MRWLSCFLFLVMAANNHLSVVADDVVDFNRDIRPILSENCFHCHGPDAEQRQADLRLDEHDGALSSIIVGDRDKSELFARVNTRDDDLRMPPVDSNRNLTSEQIELLGKWIDQGANWGQHWSWTPIVSPEVPKIEDLAEFPVRNAIDAFIRRKLDEEKLTPSPEAKKSTLIRRVTLDLTGLPPTPQEVEKFLNDTSPAAYEKLVDRLLASPAYGERMAWNWLDAARYADSNGYQGDRERTMWPWRDWVVNASNDNLPYDDFTTWQIAGDLLPDATFEQKLATGFCRNHMINGEGGRIAAENRVDYVMDMSETTATLWLGLTFNCCRCHDHKFDALSQKDYYSLFAFFNQTPVTGAGGNPQTKPILLAPTDEQSKQMQSLESQLKVARGDLATYSKELDAKESTWEAAKLESLKESETWTPLLAKSVRAEHQQLEQLEDGSIFASGPNPKNDTYEVVAPLTPQSLTGLRLDVLRHESHFQGGLARSNSGNFVLTELEVFLVNGDEESPVKIRSAEASFEQGSLKVAGVFDGNRKSGWAVYDGKPVDRDHAALFRFENPVEAVQGAELRIVLRHDSQHASHNIGRFLLSTSTVPHPKLDEAGNQSLRLALLTPTEKRTDEQKKLLRQAHQNDDSRHIKLSKNVSDLEKRFNSVRAAVAKVMVMEDQQEFRESFLLTRGLYNAPGDVVTADSPTSLPPMPTETKKDRLALAEWLVADENPLMARVVVNRFWQQVFGVGIVKTVNDFGVQGELPTHEELLNWLAADFRNSGWNVKRLIKQMVMSHTYRQSSKVTPSLFERDPENRLLARAPRYRLPSWMIRDQALAVSGLLTNRRGGPSVNVYQPPGIWEEATFGKKKYVQDHGEALYRRSLYVFWRRIIGPTIFFDNSSRQTCTVSAFRTNTPLHSLLTFNDVTYVEAGRALAEKALHLDATSDRDRLEYVFQRSLARSAEDEEATILLAGLNRSRSEYKSHPEYASEMLAIGESERDQSLDDVEHASWTSLCLAILNLDETLSKE
ncbi:PSD1 and planctomycete cytochrome C domain-containing protein [Thalassoglobus polymorphus]|uniref:Planctomycete cytochrome C n=1 Tax=Thalassoglobus polymorphus TaxID=2527994 RepID=A0A517QPP2_9PLAN|nr:PSD1 and planctomycete cytochrome C domain-containing protein [Thalassoglobus polymorphus]QDT33599.1 Planctomycete cytochrome C [Thalassoglobus polymorphus]